MTEQNTIRWDQDADGIVTLTLDDPSQRANTMNQAYQQSMKAAVDRLYAEKDTVTGVIITSAKDTFFAGGDLKLLSQVTDDNAAEFGAGVTAIKADLRRLETLGKPVVAALNGAALGGGLEIGLACHHRIALDNPKSQFGLPEVTLGLLPGGGGVTRITRLLGIADGLMKVLLQGTRYQPAQAVEIGIVDELAATPEEMLDQARAWIKANPDAVQPWDAQGYRMPGGVPSNPKLAGMLPAFPANLRKQLKGAPMPAPHHIMCAAVEGATVDIDTAFTIEGRYFVDLARGQVAKNMIQAFWFELNSINSGGSRPDGYEPRPTKKVAILGAGMMGAGIAYVSARNGIDVVLKDVSIEAAEKGKDYSKKILDKAISRGKSTEAKRDEVLARITPTADYADLAGCDLIVEAVFEKVSLKHEVFSQAEPVVAPDALLGSNTSTLPITNLAEGVQRKADFIGLHFFSPVDKMPLLEIIRGEQTSDAALARALDYAAQIKKTPIVVNDSRGFFTSRVIGTFVNEALAMLGEGIHPATVEQATTQAGYPVGALQLADELNLELFLKIRNETRDAIAASGGSYPRHPAEDVVEKMVELGRPGRSRGAGFFDYDENGKRTGLWPGLAELFPVKGSMADVDLHELEERMLVIEAVESARCVEEGVIVQTADANIGSIMGIGFPPWTGGVLQYINGYSGGITGFVERADQLAEKYGERFAPNPLLRKKAENGETF
ncbi:MAG: 3-hydroxyacyl-CoA dehydrogenase / enoyl-CoA hydratase / 3-hydroxybutyryl-CoA epimerase [Pseudonocardiales bacterium]|jgi:3-hydroxyacyl-CoA dehydrogenase/enoyl-CoA hydratase/3-hydroxybutyryl-CoA epimerase|nr:putative fatty acid oxidation complex alpha-subunit [Pseudonocardiales bacterium]MDT4961343.1 3-hydroxyacyl-CoA dehydrogenase / enoyl-CoA hydratase / 3-hydroxybutyryl-CoA epimerase [Pseudonocardiales bacterium]MDT4973002.1 3-hydroxyacyl-CoA dehydrogenase / enoyl-CoA hydratase / 3-hydroxybutyryl-CoA epimerase [Pseudonocardiales bacterium]